MRGRAGSNSANSSMVRWSLYRAVSSAGRVWEALSRVCLFFCFCFSFFVPLSLFRESCFLAADHTLLWLLRRWVRYFGLFLHSLGPKHLVDSYSFSWTSLLFIPPLLKDSLNNPLHKVRGQWSIYCKQGRVEHVDHFVTPAPCVLLVWPF